MNHTDCLFCKIASKEIHTPGIFWEDEHYMAFLSIFPSTKGFSVVIPKQHQPSDVMAMQDDELQSFILATKKVTEMLKNTFPDVGRVGVMMEGTGMNHAHTKLFPMHHTEELKEGGWKSYHSGQTFWFERYEGWFPSADGPAADHEEIASLAETIKQKNSFK